MKRIVFYFSATGNSLYVARQLAGESGEALSIPHLQKEGKLEFEADEIGIVQPLYGHMPPNIVREFISKAKLKAGYFFTIFTFGMRKCSVVEVWDRESREAGYPMDYINTVLMADNWLHHFDMTEQKMMDKHIPEQLSAIQQDLDNHRHWLQPTTNEERDIHSGFLKMAHLTEQEGFRMDAHERFAVNDDCIHCGICTKVCPRGNWSLRESRAQAEGVCDYCLACIHNCPKKTIHFNTSENPLLTPEVNPNARYRNPLVSVADIIISNNQN